MSNISWFVQAKILPEDASGDDTTGVGELCIKSPSLFKEYWKLPEVLKSLYSYPISALHLVCIFLILSLSPGCFAIMLYILQQNHLSN